MAYADLTSDQKRQLQDWMKIVRPMMGEFARLLNHFTVAKIAHTSHVSDILDLLVDSDVIPNTSGMSGATDVVKSELTETLTDANALLTTYDTSGKQQLRDKMAGAENTLG